MAAPVGGAYDYFHLDTGATAIQILDSEVTQTGRFIHIEDTLGTLGVNPPKQTKVSSEIHDGAWRENILIEAGWGHNFTDFQGIDSAIAPVVRIDSKALGLDTFTGGYFFGAPAAVIAVEAVLGTARAITAMTLSTTTVIGVNNTACGGTHCFLNGETVNLAVPSGPVQLNGFTGLVASEGTTSLQIVDFDSQPVISSRSPAWSSGGTVSKLTGPYDEIFTGIRVSGGAAGNSGVGPAMTVNNLRTMICGGSIGSGNPVGITSVSSIGLEIQAQAADYNVCPGTRINGFTKNISNLSLNDGQGVKIMQMPWVLWAGSAVPADVTYASQAGFYERFDKTINFYGNFTLSGCTNNGTNCTGGGANGVQILLPRLANAFCNGAVAIGFATGFVALAGTLSASLDSPLGFASNVANLLYSSATGTQGLTDLAIFTSTAMNYSGVCTANSP